ncbi:hypothetical protein Tco_1078383 [Tanacetum coccineum]|uniref:Uncharacterized protein n=1 Tax=Tanacetum coccineum TaxID=301880 RepID=A0ABQ5HNU2_9ASTR
MDRNNVYPISVSINTKFLNSLQPEWSKYVTMVCHNQTGDVVSYDELYDSLVQFKPHVLASKPNKSAKYHDPLALLVHSNASSSQSHASSSYSPQPYYVKHPSSVKFSTPTNNRLRTSSNIRNQAVIQDGRVDIQTKNAGYGGNGHYAHDYQKPRVRDAKYFREQMSLAMKDEAESNLKDEENDFMLDNSNRDETLEELTAASASEAGSGYKNLKRLKKAIAAQPKMYHGEMLRSTNLKINSPDFEETVEDAEASRLKMRNKTVQLNYEKLNALFETFSTQQEPSVEETYFLFPSTSNDCSESKEVTSDLPIP